MKEQDPESVEVGAPVEWAAEDRFGCDVWKRPADLARFVRHARVRRQTEVGELQAHRAALAAHEDVRRLDVPVNQSGRVDVFQASQDLHCQLLQGGGRLPPRPERLVCRQAVHVLQDEVGRSVRQRTVRGRGQLVGLDDVGVSQSRPGLEFGRQGMGWTGPLFVGTDLQRHYPLLDAIVGSIDRRHSAPAQRADDEKAIVLQRRRRW